MKRVMTPHRYPDGFAEKKEENLTRLRKGNLASPVTHNSQKRTSTSLHPSQPFPFSINLPKFPLPTTAIEYHNHNGRRYPRSHPRPNHLPLFSSLFPAPLSSSQNLRNLLHPPAIRQYPPRRLRSKHRRLPVPQTAPQPRRSRKNSPPRGFQTGAHVPLRPRISPLRNRRWFWSRGRSSSSRRYIPLPHI
jgi:hypothetical protein